MASICLWLFMRSEENERQKYKFYGLFDQWWPAFGTLQSLKFCVSQNYILSMLLNGKIRKQGEQK